MVYYFKGEFVLCLIHYKTLTGEQAHIIGDLLGEYFPRGNEMLISTDLKYQIEKIKWWW